MKPSVKFGSATPSPAMSKRSIPVMHYKESCGGQSVARAKTHQPTSLRRNYPETASSHQSRSDGSSAASKAANGSFPMTSYKGTAINYHCNPLENVTTNWDDEGSDDCYSRSISGVVDGDGDAGSQSDDGTEEMASSVYDNSPVMYRPPRGKPATSSPSRKHVAK